MCKSTCSGESKPLGWAVIAGVVLAAIGIGVGIWAELRSQDKTVITKYYDTQGHYLGYGISTTHDPLPFEIEINRNTYTVTEYGVRYNSYIPPQLIGLSSMEPYLAGQQITGYNLSSFQITSIKAL